MSFDVLGIGNAIVDLLSFCEEDFLHKHNIQKGGMTLIDEARAEELYQAMGPVIEISGGSCANTMAGLASLGGLSAYTGKVKEDVLGKSFRHDITKTGVTFTTFAATEGPATARCAILVTPDGERSMNTFLGACTTLSEKDVDEAQVAAAKICYFEGYLWDPPLAKEALRKAATIAHKHSRKMAITLSDSFCVDRYRAEFLDLMRTKTVDIVFANEAELKSLYETSDFDSALAALKNDVALAAVTRSEKGCVIAQGTETVEVAAFPVEKIVDTTGAGDLFASGVLYGLAHNLPLKRCGELGALCAAEIISHIGARPQVSLKQLAMDKGLL